MNVGIDTMSIDVCVLILCPKSLLTGKYKHLKETKKWSVNRIDDTITKRKRKNIILRFIYI